MHPFPEACHRATIPAHRCVCPTHPLLGLLESIILEILEVSNVAHIQSHSCIPELPVPYSTNLFRNIPDFLTLFRTPNMTEMGTQSPPKKSLARRDHTKNLGLFGGHQPWPIWWAPWPGRPVPSGQRAPSCPYRRTFCDGHADLRKGGLGRYRSSERPAGWVGPQSGLAGGATCTGPGARQHRAPIRANTGLNIGKQAPQFGDNCLPAFSGLPWLCDRLACPTAPCIPK